MLRVVEAVASLYAEARVAGRAFPPFGEHDGVGVSVHVVSDGAADATVRADRFDALQVLPRLDRHYELLVGQCPGWANGGALAARDTGAVAHRYVQIERDSRPVTLPGAPDDVVVLDLVAGADAAVTEDAGGEIHVDDR
jgi:hypothetical protein